MCPLSLPLTGYVTSFSPLFLLRSRFLILFRSICSSRDEQTWFPVLLFLLQLFQAAVPTSSAVVGRAGGFALLPEQSDPVLAIARLGGLEEDPPLPTVAAVVLCREVMEVLRAVLQQRVVKENQCQRWNLNRFKKSSTSPALK